MRGSDGVGLERRVNVHGLRNAKGLSAGLGLANDAGPDSVASGKGRDEEVRAGGVKNVLLCEGSERRHVLAALEAKIWRDEVANPPDKGRLDFGITRVIVALKARFDFHRVITWNVAVNDSMTQTFGRLLF